jgi:glutathione S-transferase
MTAILYGTPGSHPSKSAELMLRHAGVAYSRRDLPNMNHKPLLKLLGFSVRTVPVLKLDGRRVETTRAITRELGIPVPDETLEAWADDDLQECVRALGRWAAVRDRSSMASFLDGPVMGIPAGVVKATLPVLGPLTAMRMKVSEDVMRRSREALPGHLDRVDALLADGTIGGAEPNALDFQIAPSVRLAMCFDQLRDEIAARPAGGFAVRVCADFPGRFGTVLP